MEKITAIVIGAGSRGQCYTNEMFKYPDKFQVVGVAEPIENRREFVKNKHSISDEHCFDTWEKILELPKFADVAIISTMDRMHFAPAMEAIRKGYNLLLEKPAAPTAEECFLIEKEAKKYGVKILVCHVLRYTPFYKTLKSIIDEGKLGKIMSIQHCENVGNTHQSHSFVRGNWGNSVKSTPMLLQKCCHDMDILQWLVGKDVKRASSFGSRSYFTEDNAPEGAPEYCIDGCPHADTCYYNAVKLYLESDSKWFRGAATGIVDPTDEQVEAALHTTQYGKCVYKCDNDVVDHQVVNLEFEDGTVVDFNMCAFNQGGRFIRIMGTKGEIYNVGEGHLKLFDFATRQIEEIDVYAYGNTIDSGHGGGDAGIIRALYDYITTGEVTEQLSEIGISVKNHMIVFAAEQARLTGQVVDVEEFKKTIQ